MAWRSLGPLALAFVAAQLGCSEDKPPKRTQAPTVIGVSLGLSGDLAGFSQPLLNAIRLAEHQVNSKGGLFGRPVELRVVDDGSDGSERLLRGIRELVDQGAVAFLGPEGSGQVLAVHGFLAERKLPLVSPSATAVELSSAQPAGDRFLFRTTPADDLQSRAVVAFAERGPRGLLPDAGAGAGPTCRKMALVRMENAYANGMAEGVRSAFTERGGSIVEDVSLGPTAAPDYKNEVSRVLAAKPDCQVVLSYPPPAAQYMINFKEGLSTATPPGWNSQFFTIGTDGIFTSDFLSKSRKEPSAPPAAEGVFGTNPDTTPDTREYYDFRTLYRAMYGGPASVDEEGAFDSQFAANAYDAAILLVLALQSAGPNASGSAVRDALVAVSSAGRVFGPAQVGDALQALREGQDIDYKGASGDVDFDEYGNVVSNYVVWNVQNGEYRIVGQIPTAELD